MADKGQRTEQPTPRRIEKARREGRFAVSRELVSAIQFLTFALLAAAYGNEWLARFQQTTRYLLQRAFQQELNAAELLRLLDLLSARNLVPLAFCGVMLLGVTLGAQLAATRFGFAVKKAAPDFKRLNFLVRMRELPRQNFSVFLQALLMLPLFAAAVYAVVKSKLDVLLRMPLQDVAVGARQLGGSILELFWRAGAVFLALGAFDYWRQRRRYMADLRMTKQEIRDEAKEVEGNPQVRARIRRLQRDLLRRRMMQQVPKATAVIVNPTHYAVAIRYRLEEMTAPKVVAKGKNYLALRIRQKAVEHQVPVVENPPLAQALYRSAEVGQEIPPHLYRAVAEILAYIYRLMRGRLPG